MPPLSFILALALSIAPAVATDAPATPAVAQAPVVIRIGTTAVMTIRAPLGKQTIAERAAVIQSRIDNVLLNHPYLTAQDVKLMREKGVLTLYWGRFPITAIDEAHAAANHFSSADLLGHAWANSLRSAAKTFFAAKHMPGRALWKTPAGDEFIYRRTKRTFDQPAMLENRRYIFSPADFEWGAGVRVAGQKGFVVFTRKDDKQHPPHQLYLGNAAGTFTEYDWIKPEETP